MNRSQIKATPTLVFQHIPKTAGVSVRSVIVQNYSVGEILHVPDTAWRDPTYALASIGHYKFLHGHLHYDFLAPIASSASLITFVRDPVERVMSTYFFLRNQPVDSTQTEAGRYCIQYAQSKSIVDFVSSTNPLLVSIVSNYQVQCFLSSSQSLAPSETWLSSAKANLGSYQFIGIADPDLIDASVAEMALLFGWVKPTTTPVVNQTKRSLGEQETQVAAKIVAERNPLDCQLHRELRERFHSAATVGKAQLSKYASTRKLQRRAYRTGLTSPVTMDQPLRCWGWHDRESSIAGKTWRCAATKQPGMELRLGKTSSCLLYFEIKSVVQRVHFSATRVVSVGRGVESVAFIAGNKWFLVVFVTGDLIDQDGICTLEFSMQERDSVDLIAGDVHDDRTVFIGLEAIHIVTDKMLPQALLEISKGHIIAHRSSNEATIELNRAVQSLQSARQTDRDNAQAQVKAQTDRAVRAETYSKSLAEELLRVKGSIK